jgi:hypothetical protein
MLCARLALPLGLDSALLQSPARFRHARHITAALTNDGVRSSAPKAVA